MRKRRAIAAVETAFIAPFLLGLLFGIWEVGQLLHVDEYVNNSCREGARLCATGTYSASAVLGSQTYTSTTYQVQTAVGNYLKNTGVSMPSSTGGGISGTTPIVITVTNQTQNLTQVVDAVLDSGSGSVVLTPVGSSPGSDPVLIANQFDMIQVNVTFPFSFARWSPNNLFFYLGANPTISATTTWQCLRDLPVSVDSTIPNSPLP